MSYESICQNALRKHYRLFRKKIRDDFFVSSEYQANKAVNEMLNMVNKEIEKRSMHENLNEKIRLQNEYIRTKYIAMGREYAIRYCKSLDLFP
ncbi:hypothetical protein GWK08_09030 [Leptobacterium flavescens]|uniref:Uncharacterized protein n=1 Tax=Leptobacterium flavescens TaxID=472055 RepID=A0A6P0UNT7_9FLAO|nr:hypothetical protein [Leptobacterium flavescens]NER13578.1 hypothetical protein [Leptobacterium flavescens]